MADLNKVFLIGNLTRDPEMRQVSDQASVTKMGLATSRRFTTRNGEDREETCFVDVDVWGRQAEACNQYLRKGSPAFVEGRLALDQWEDQSGQRRSKLYVRAERVQFLGSPSRGADFQQGQGNQYGSGDSQAPPPQQPQQQGAPTPQFQQQPQPPQQPQQPQQQQQAAQQPPPQQQAAQPPPQNQMPKFEEDGQESVQDDIPF